MSDTMLHGILQMPTELWTNDAIDIAQRHGRYCEASKRIIELESERNEAREALKRLKKELVSANRGAETNAKVNQSLAKKLHDLEGYAARARDHLQASSTMHRETMNERDEARRERDDALKEWDIAREGWNKALEERDEARRMATVWKRVALRETSINGEEEA